MHEKPKLPEKIIKLPTKEKTIKTKVIVKKSEPLVREKILPKLLKSTEERKKSGMRQTTLAVVSKSKKDKSKSPSIEGEVISSGSEEEIESPSSYRPPSPALDKKRNRAQFENNSPDTSEFNAKLKITKN